MTDIKIITSNRDLYLLCREILLEIPASEWTLSQPADKESVTPADLHIWDYQPGMRFPEEITRRSSRQLFLVYPEHLASFREVIQSAGTAIILQPVSRAVLASYLTLEVTANEEGIRPGNSLRADHDEMLRCLTQVNLRLQEYDQNRTDFLSRTVHDFRTPLTAVTGYCNLLLSDMLGELNQTQKEVIQRTRYSASRLARMTNSMLEVSIGGRIKRIPHLRPGDIRDCIDQAIHEIKPLAEGKTISVDVTPNSDGLCFERGQIEQVLINLLDNACKFTQRKGAIEIRGYPCFWERREPRGRVAFDLDRRRQPSREPNCYRIDIRNSGPIIPSEQLKTIFEEYASYGGNSERPGAGLGLAICRTIVRQHHGRIWAENTDAGPLIAFVLPYNRDGELLQLAKKEEV